MEERRGVLEEGSAFTLEALQHQASSLPMQCLLLPVVLCSACSLHKLGIC